MKQSAGRVREQSGDSGERTGTGDDEGGTEVGRGTEGARSIPLGLAGQHLARTGRDTDRPPGPV